MPTETAEETFQWSSSVQRHLGRHACNGIGLLRNLPETLEQASHLDRFGHVYAEAGLWTKAMSLQKKLVEFCMARLGRYNALTIHAQKSLANSYWNLFDIGNCLEVLQQVRMAHMLPRPSISDWMVWSPWKPTHVAYCVCIGRPHPITLACWTPRSVQENGRESGRLLDAETGT